MYLQWNYIYAFICDLYIMYMLLTECGQNVRHVHLFVSKTDVYHRFVSSCLRCRRKKRVPATEKETRNYICVEKLMLEAKVKLRSWLSLLNQERRLHDKTIHAASEVSFFILIFTCWIVSPSRRACPQTLPRNATCTDRRDRGRSPPSY